MISRDVYRRSQKAAFIVDLPNFCARYVTEVQNQES